MESELSLKSAFLNINNNKKLCIVYEKNCLSTEYLVIIIFLTC